MVVARRSSHKSGSWEADELINEPILRGGILVNLMVMVVPVPVLVLVLVRMRRRSPLFRNVITVVVGLEILVVAHVAGGGGARTKTTPY